MKEIIELVEKLTQEQIQEIADTWQAAKEIIEQRSKEVKTNEAFNNRHL